MKYLQVVDAPDGRRYLVIAAPPGSALAGDLFPRGHEVGAAVGIVRFLSNLVRGRWSIAVEEVDEQGRAKGAVHNEAAASEGEADRRVAAISAQIREGSWLP